MVLHGGEPELWNALDVLIRLSRLLFLVSGLSSLFFLLLVVLAGLDLLLGGLSIAIDNGGTLLVKWCELGEVFLFQLEDLFLELSLEFGVLLLDALQASDALLDLGRQGLDVTGGAANKGAKSALDQLDKLWVLREDRGSCGILCGEAYQYCILKEPRVSVVLTDAG